MTSHQPPLIACVPVLKDNYAWLIIEPSDGSAVVVDPSESAPVIHAADALDVHLSAIWNTHHHHDHVGGNAGLCERYGPIPVHGSAIDGELGRIPKQSVFHRDGDVVRLSGQEVLVLHVPGHTLGHLAYYVAGMLFIGDTLFGAGCGRLFEGTPEEMFSSLSRLREIPDDTLIYCAHEYTLANLKFACTILPDNEALKARLSATTSLMQPQGGAPLARTVPLTLREEKQTNLFLRWDAPDVMRATGETDPVRVFAALRRRKDRF
ncbi:MAG: hydroxyacylglutathione hydrolase [Deltaproteobacteria bacterium]|nr:hydroxyacylglutathione hydrolase [Deltaproteobacteria bacterium]